MKIDLTKCLLCCVVFFSCILHFNIQAQDKPKHLTFSYVNHPVIINDIAPIVQRAYLELGIHIELVMLPSSRNLKAIESGEVDGDIAFSNLLLKDRDMLIKIKPSFGSSILVLLCLPDIQCKQDVLFNNNSIVTTDTIYESLLKFYSQHRSDSFYTINDLSAIPNLLVQKRFQYGVYVLRENQTMSADFQHLQVVKLIKSDIYHTIHKKYGFMKDEISAALQRAIAKAKK
ncbi:MAG: hypothetical protein JKY14_11165 [Paraglaciecola sp.]|nr:hypothetical protein [Paraglaciecola sp.]